MNKYFLAIVVLFSSIIYSQIDDKKTSASSFLSVGAISVTIGGDFIITGTYPAFITERVDQFITRMYNEGREKILDIASQQPELIEKAQKEIESYSLRNVILKRANGEELSLDLIKFRRTGDFTNNPYLKNDDVLIFPPADFHQ